MNERNKILKNKKKINFVVLITSIYLQLYIFKTNKNPKTI